MAGVDLGPSFCSSGKPIRALPSIYPSVRLILHERTRMQVDVPKWRGTLEQTMKMSKSRVVVETLNYATLSAFSPSGTVLTPEVVLDAISNDQNGAYHLFAATQKVLDEYENRKALKEILQRDPKLLKFSGLVFNQLLVEIGIAIMDHLPGPHFTFIDPYWALPQEDSDNNSLTEMTAHEIVGHARRLHGMFVAAGIDGQRVIIGLTLPELKALKLRIDREVNFGTDTFGELLRMQARSSCVLEELSLHDSTTGANLFEFLQSLTSLRSLTVYESHSFRIQDLIPWLANQPPLHRRVQCDNGLPNLKELHLLTGSVLKNGNGEPLTGLADIVYERCNHVEDETSPRQKLEILEVQTTLVAFDNMEQDEYDALGLFMQQGLKVRLNQWMPNGSLCYIGNDL